MSNQKRGFRLPWAADRDPDGNVQTAEIDPPALDLLPHGEAGEADVINDESTDAVPAASNVPEVTAEAEMFDTETPSAPSANGARPEEATFGAAWPSSDRAPSTEEGDAVPRTDFGAPADSGSLAALESLKGATTDAQGTADINASDTSSEELVRPPIRVASEPRAGRRENPLVAGLVKAMREAAIASREETTTRLQAEATARTEEIRTAATDEAAAIRKQVDDDIAGIRDWSKAEMARIRQQTEERIEARKAEAVHETRRHEEAVERRVGAVQATVSAFETEMASFFEQLLAENDPARLATLAERAPEPPDLTFELPGSESGANPADASGLEATAAAEAEAEATEGLDLTQSNEWPAAVLAARLGAVPAPESANGSSHTSQLMVSGLGSVAAISAFKGAVGQLPGVDSVSVTSGEKGVFIFNVGHDPEFDLGPAVASLSGFVVAILDATDESYTITVHEAAA